MLSLARRFTPPRPLLYACLLVPALAALGVSPVEAQVRRPLPVVQRVQPTSGPPGTAVTLHGRFFDRAQTLWLGSTELAVTSRFPNRWVVTIPDGARSGVIEVHTARGNTRGPRFRVSAVAPPPVVASFAPSAGSVGEEVVISGERFSTRPSENHVFLGETPVVVRTATRTELHVLVPAGAETHPFRVRVTGAGEASSESSFTVVAGTAITSFEPTVGPARTRVTLTGTGFSRSRRSVTVSLGETRARVIRASETELTVEVPRRGETGRWTVQIRGGGRAISTDRFEVRSPPTVASMTPTFGAPGTRVTLTGANFGTDIRRVTAQLGETAMQVRDIADDRLVLEVPATASTGRISVTVGGLGPARTASFRVTGAVSVSGFSPTAGPAGTEVTITGAGFSTDTAHDTVTLGRSPAEVVRASATELVVRIPEAASGRLTVSVENAGSARTTAPFVVTHPPTVSGFSPVGGPPGTEVTIRGAGFGRLRGLLDVRIGQTRLEVVRATGDTVVVRIPRGAASGPIRVTLRLEGSATSAERFAVHGE